MAATSRIPAPRVSPEGSRARAGRGRTAIAPGPLGSLTQRDDRPDSFCRDCGSGQVTVLTMNLTDGTPVRFTSCHRCEHRTWEHAGDQLSVDVVLERSRKG